MPQALVVVSRIAACIVTLTALSYLGGRTTLLACASLLTQCLSINNAIVANLCGSLLGLARFLVLRGLAPLIVLYLKLLLLG